MSFKVGDTVKLKSGGPDMTVTRIGTAGDEPMVWCAWFEGTRDVYGLFPPDALRASPSDPADAVKPSPELQPNADPERQHQAPSERLPTEVGSAPMQPEPAEAQDPQPTEADRLPVAEKGGSSLEAEIASMRSLMTSWLKRP
jgi:uncharacterized protein YodC (DUF2158 family)